MSNNNKFNSRSNSYMNFDIPKYNYLGDHDLNDHGAIESLLETLQSDFAEGYFLTWEAVERNEQGLPLTNKQKKALSDLVSFNEDGSDRIFYIDDMPRPDEPWYEIIRKIAEHLVVDKFRTYDVHFAVTTSGWEDLVEIIEEYGDDLSMPEGVKSPMDIIPLELQHQLWLQWCFEELEGIGQDDLITLADQEEYSRIENFIEGLRECKESVQYLKLTLRKLFNILILPEKDEKILIDNMIAKLGLTSIDDQISDYL